ncbi:extracellular solute-binding protein family [Marssonina coronariae]|uniref:Extracellular solute-binding protein family n=1 Tax=Diplocarpon coronariae TaxID=2795749 RepID=A0A218ZCU3_9HELO|nr:extracellular solute-binding protein family [Marssonina coronariae]
MATLVSAFVSSAAAAAVGVNITTGVSFSATGQSFHFALSIPRDAGSQDLYFAMQARQFSRRGEDVENMGLLACRQRSGAR